MDIWFIGSRILLLLSALLLLSYEIKLLRSIVVPRAKKLGLGIWCLLLGTILFLVSGIMIQPYIEPIAVMLIAIGIFMYVYRLIGFTMKLHHLAHKDTLTGLANRRCLFAKLNGGLRFAEETSIMFLDIDNFKSINDQIGHQAADKILCSIINEMQNNLRSTDILSRYGGDEFVIILPKTSKETAAIILERLKESVYNVRFEEGIRVSISGGIATSPEDGTSLEELIYMADQQMYIMKMKKTLRTIS